VVAGQAHGRGEPFRGGAVGCDGLGDGEDAGPAVAQGRVGDAGEPRGVTQRGESRVLGCLPAVVVADREAGQLQGAGDPEGAVFSELSNDHEEGLRELQLMRSPGGLEDSLGHELSVVVVDAGKCFGEIDGGSCGEAGSDAQHAFLSC
jgi:hypothetical protein